MTRSSYSSDSDSKLCLLTFQLQMYRSLTSTYTFRVTKVRYMSFEYSVLFLTDEHDHTGRSRYDRLLHIGKHSKVLAVDALRAAVREAKKGDDVGRYREACLYLQAVAPNDEEAQIDQEWERKKEEQNKKETLRLENELKGYKNNLIKESIRVRPAPQVEVCWRLYWL